MKIGKLMISLAISLRDIANHYNCYCQDALETIQEREIEVSGKYASFFVVVFVLLCRSNFSLGLHWLVNKIIRC